MKLHIFVPTDAVFFADLAVPDWDWVCVNGRIEPAELWREAIAFVDANDLWEPCSHGWECWLE